MEACALYLVVWALSHENQGHVSYLSQTLPWSHFHSKKTAQATGSGWQGKTRSKEISEEAPAEWEQEMVGSEPSAQLGLEGQPMLSLSPEQQFPLPTLSRGIKQENNACMPRQGLCAFLACTY